MDKFTVELIKNQIIGETNGHMSSIPNNPMLFSVVQSYMNAKEILDINKGFELFIHDLSNSIDENNNKTA